MTIELFLIIIAVSVLFVTSAVLRLADMADKRKAVRNIVDRLCDNARLNTDLKAKSRFKKTLGMLFRSKFIKKRTIVKAAMAFMKIAKDTPDPLDRSYCLDWAGRCYEDFGDSELAEDCYSTALNISPSDDFAAKRLGDYYYDSAPEESVRHYERALEYDPLSSVTYYKLAKVHSTLGEGEKAITRYQTAISTNNAYVAPMAEAAIESAKMGNIANLLKFYFLAMANDVCEFEKLEEALKECLT